MNNSARFAIKQSIALKSVEVLAFLFFGLTVLAALKLMISDPPAAWIDLLYDDAYYYLGIARGVVETGTTSYLPPFKTNGYQPLWMSLISLVTALFGTENRAMAVATFSLGALFIFAFAIASHRAYGLSFIAVISAMAMPQITLWGMETAMMPLFVLLFFTSRRWKTRGFFGALIIFTRLDALALIFASDTYHCWKQKKVAFSYLRHYIVICPAALIYVALNQLYYGIPLPVSGLSKAIGHVPGENLIAMQQFFSVLLNPILALGDSTNLLQQLSTASLSPLLLLIALCFLKHFVQGNLHFQHQRELIILTVTSLVVSTYYTVMSGWSVWPWYSWPLMLWTYYIAQEAIGTIKVSIGDIRLSVNSENITPDRLQSIDLASRATRIFAAAIVFALLFAAIVRPAFWFSKRVFVAALTKSAPTTTYGVLNTQMANFIKQGGLPLGNMFAMGDRAGSLGFLLGRDYSFIHTEGLVGSTAYYLAMKADKGLAFLEAQHPNYLIAEREQFYQIGPILGVAEPLQGLSERTGPYLVCFPRSAIVYAVQYQRTKNAKFLTKRYIFNFNQRVTCPVQLQLQFDQDRSRYQGIKRFALPSEY